MRYQRGYVYLASASFYVRYYINGKQFSHRLCGKDDKFYSTKCRDVQRLREGFMRTVNEGTENPQSDTTVMEFWEKTYWPFVLENLRHSTAYGYTQIWSQHLGPHFGNTTLREYRTSRGSLFLTGLAKTLGRSTLAHIRSLASGIFSHAVNVGLIESNPWRDVKILGRVKESAATAHYSLEELENIISVLIARPDCQAIMALAGFMGLRPSEIQGLEWSDVEDDWIHVRRSIVRGRAGTLKTPESAASLPVIAPVRIALSLWRPKCPEGRRVFPQELKTLIKLVIRPALEAKGLTWKGLYAGRRGAATILTGLTGNAIAAKELLRHKNLSVTTANYVKTMPKELMEGMRLLESKVTIARVEGADLPGGRHDV